MSEASFNQRFPADRGPLPLFNRMFPGEQNASRTLCNTSTSSGVASVGPSETGSTRRIINRDSITGSDIFLTAEYIESHPDYRRDTASQIALNHNWNEFEVQEKPDEEGKSIVSEESFDQREKSEDGVSERSEETSSDTFYDTDSTDNENEPLAKEPNANEEDETPPWDAFAEIPWVADHEINETGYKLCRKILKVLTYIFLFASITLLTVVSKGSVIMATSKLRPFPSSGPATADTSTPDMRCQDIIEVYNRTIFDKNDTFTEPVKEQYTMCVTIPRGFDVNGTQFSCLAPQNRSGKAYITTVLSSYGANECVVSRIYWAWSLYLMICTPYFFICLRNLWRLIFKSEKRSRHLTKTMLIAVAIETLHSIGLSLLVFLVLPSLDNAFQMVMFMLGVAFLPGSLKILIRPETESLGIRLFKIVFGMLAVIGQLSAIVVWPILVGVLHEEKSYEWHLTWSIPLSLVLISVRWWENFVDEKSRLGRILRPMRVLASRIRRARIKVQLVASLWKMAVTLLVMMVCVALQIDDIDRGQDYDLSQRMTAVFDFDLSQCQMNPKIDKMNETVRTISEEDLPPMELDWVWMWLTNCCTSLVCYFLARSAAKIRIQRLAYALPLILTTPILVAMVVGMCEIWNDDPCSYTGNDLDGYLFFKCYEAGKISTVGLDQLWYLIVFWWLSQLWITAHIWFPKSERLAMAERLFVLPLFDGVLLEQSLLLNRARNDAPKTFKRSFGKFTPNTAAEEDKRRDMEDGNRETYLGKLVREGDSVPMIYICATMWHENRREMIQMLTSIFKLDADQAARRNAKKFFNVRDPDYYEFEAHIFFDDAVSRPKDLPEVANSFVQLLVSVVDQAASSVHDTVLELPPPTRYPTPYGGRLEWHMPGGNRLIAHLKDKAKIRPGKRWSQVMYMYYFLGSKLWAGDMDINRKERKSSHTYLLALDGDVDFEPIALILLLDLMRRNEKVGAACGRIHPTGTGPLVWYQKFEYAIGHWMQKATEHVIGCVLCSPGCFSLMRGSALMADNVMKKYTTIADLANEHIQYDQGEDRWLCTLILQEGYRVEYCAASDSFTFAPEGFNEFFNQRRRWMPSTMANIIDLLTSWRHTTTANENISSLYMFYQMMLFVASLVGPGTIFMMMVGALTAAVIKWIDITLTISAILNLIPVIVFIVLCYVAKPAKQLWFALVMAAVYCLIQVLVLIGTIVTMADKGLCYPTTVFFLFVTGTFLLCAVLHPQEFFCVIHGFTYFLAIPTMYMMLMIYAMCNLHIISWGTREVKETSSETQAAEQLKKEMEELKKLEEEAKRKGIIGGLLEKLSLGKKRKGCRCGNILNIACCSHQDQTEPELLQALLTSVDNIDRTLTQLQTGLRGENQGGDAGTEESDQSNDETTKDDDDEEPEYIEIPTFPFSDLTDEELMEFLWPVEQLKDSEDESEEGSETSTSSSYEDWGVRGPINSEDWIRDNEHLGDGPIKELDEKETLFFQQLIARYLSPMVLTADEQQAIKDDLLELRNRMSSGFLFTNGVFVITLYVLQSNTATLYIPWPCKDKHGEDIKLDPLGFTFLIMFGVLMIIQILGMLVHRATTFLQVMATTVLTRTPKEDDEESTESMIKLAKKLGNLQREVDRVHPFASTIGSGSTGYGMGRRHHIQTTRIKAQALTVNAAFERNWSDLKKDLEDDRKTVDGMSRRILGRTLGGLTQRQATLALRTLRQRQLDGGTMVGTTRRTAADTESSMASESVGRNTRRGVRFVVGSEQSSSYSSSYSGTRSRKYLTYVNRAFSTRPEPLEDYD